MSAIIGRLSFDPAEILARTVLDQMLDASATGTLETRSVFAVPGIALGWCGPARPDGTSAIGTSDRHHIRAVADSRLTNAGELRAELEREGHRFHARTDEELIAHAYDRWGTGGFERLRGPFACAVWDDTTRRLVLAREPRPQELKVLLADLADHTTRFRAGAKAAHALISAGESPRDASLDPVDLAACTALAGLILNLDETITKQ